MRTLKQLEDLAKVEGHQRGQDAASWFFDGNTSRETYAEILKGIQDGDPAVLDRLPSADLSGEWADSPTPQTLYDVLSMNEAETERFGDEVCSAFEQAYGSAVQDVLEREAMSMLEQDVTFTIEVTTDQDPQQLLNKLTDLLAKENCSLNSDEFEAH